MHNNCNSSTSSPATSIVSPLRYPRQCPLVSNTVLHYVIVAFMSFLFISWKGGEKFVCTVQHTRKCVFRKMRLLTTTSHGRKIHHRHHHTLLCVQSVSRFYGRNNQKIQKLLQCTWRRTPKKQEAMRSTLFASSSWMEDQSISMHMWSGICENGIFLSLHDRASWSLLYCLYWSWCRFLNRRLLCYSSFSRLFHYNLQVSPVWHGAKLLNFKVWIFSISPRGCLGLMQSVCLIVELSAAEQVSARICSYLALRHNVAKCWCSTEDSKNAVAGDVMTRGLTAWVSFASTFFFFPRLRRKNIFVVVNYWYCLLGKTTTLRIQREDDFIPFVW